MKKRQLNKKEIEAIQDLAKKKLIEYCKFNDIIGTNIFSILERDNKVLYYPLEDQKVWGFLYAQERKLGKDRRGYCI